jgi:hypothetical protein
MSDATIVKPSYQLGTPVIPIDQGQGIFLEHFQLPKQYLAVDGKLLPVAVLKFDTAYDLIGVSQDRTLLHGGHIDFTDSLDGEVSIDALYYRDEFSKDAEWKIIDVTAFSERFCFDKAVESNSRVLGLQELIVLPLTIDGEEHSVRYGMAGEVNLEFGNVKVWWGINEILTAPSGRQKELRAKILNLNPLRGFKVGAYRANANRAPR